MTTPQQPLTNVLGAPADDEMERNVLGAILIDPRAYSIAAEKLRSQDFFLLRHQYIWSAFEALTKANTPIERGTVRVELQRRNQWDMIGGDLYITELVTNSSNTVYLPFHVEVIARHAVRRRGIKAAEDALAIYQDLELSTEEAVSMVESQVISVRDNWQTDSIRTGQGLEEEMLELLNFDAPPTIPMPFSRLNEQIGGLPRGNVSILAGTPGLGKTWMGLNIGLQVAQMTVGNRKPRVLVFSLEMTRKLELNPRLLSMQTGIPEWKIKGAKKHIVPDMTLKKQFTEAVFTIGGLDLHVDDRTRVTPAYVRSKVAQLKPDLVIIDYLQLMEDDKDHRGNEFAKVANIVYELKNVAKESHEDVLRMCNILLLSQFNRAGIRETRANGKGKNTIRHIGDLAPEMDALLNSSAIEQHCTPIMMLAQDEELAERNILAVCTRKNRFGAHWFTGDWKYHPPLLHRDPETGAMTDPGIARFPALDDDEI